MAKLVLVLIMVLVSTVYLKLQPAVVPATATQETQQPATIQLLVLLVPVYDGSAVQVAAALANLPA
jgi:hypothetical protein